jgi:diaminopimelate epimerase
MICNFYKYQGTGNDFIIIDGRVEPFITDTAAIARLCDRHLGIGADGLMIMTLEEGYDFRMTYYNSDGKESTMCGNGGRCMVAFAKYKNLVKEEAHFIAIDGPHNAEIMQDGCIKLQMNNVTDIEQHEGYSLLNTGSPHYVKWVNDPYACNVFSEGRAIRNEERFMPLGINVNFATAGASPLIVRTYERGVEAETLSCGTGVTAAAIASTQVETGSFCIPVETPGGNLEVRFIKPNSHSATEVYLSGPATFVFSGSIEI